MSVPITVGLGVSSASTAESGGTIDVDSAIVFNPQGSPVSTGNPTASQNATETPTSSVPVDSPGGGDVNTPGSVGSGGSDTVLLVLLAGGAVLAYFALKKKK